MKEKLPKVAKKLALVLLLVLLYIILFMPYSDPQSAFYSEGKLRNRPLFFLAISVAALHLVSRFLKTAILTHRAARLMKKEGLRVRKCTVLLHRARILAEDAHGTYYVSVYGGVRQVYRYHLTGTGALEIYKTTRESYAAVRPGGQYTHAMRSGAAKTALKKRVRLLQYPNAEKGPTYRILLFDRFPEILSDETHDVKRGPLADGSTADSLRLCTLATLIEKKER